MGARPANHKHPSKPLAEGNKEKSGNGNVGKEERYVRHLYTTDDRILVPVIIIIFISINRNNNDEVYIMGWKRLKTASKRW